MSGPALVSILRQDTYLIASVHTALDDSEILRFQQDLIEQIGQHRSRGVIIDVAALDVLDSFAQRTLGNLAEMARLRGALTVIVGIRPEVALAMAQLGMGTGSVATALDLQEGLIVLNSRIGLTDETGEDARCRSRLARRDMPPGAEPA
jgi:rsbT antagonist protein RsbS